MEFSFKSLSDAGGYVYGKNNTDANGNPSGGRAEGMGIDITWQDGPVNRDNNEVPNGAFVEDVLLVCIQRLEFYQESKFACDSNLDALHFVHEAIRRLMERRDDRRKRGVEGKHET